MDYFKLKINLKIRRGLTFQGSVMPNIIYV